MADIHELVRIDAAPERVFEAIATKDGLASWWTADVQHNGKSLDLGFEGHSVIFHMLVQSENRPNRIVWQCTGEQPNWTGTHLTFDIRPEGNGTTLRFTHSGWRAADDYMAECSYTWPHVLDRLKAFSENGKPVPYFV
jgi:uncharacterized protein YndB with AHSA1/START domain